MKLIISRFTKLINYIPYGIKFSEIIINARYTKKSLLFIIIFFYSQNVDAQIANLDFYINTAIKNSPLLQDLQYKAASNNIDIDRIKALLKPQVYGIANNSIAPVIGGFGYDAALTNIGSFNELINVNKTFTGKKNLDAQFNTVRLVNDSLLYAQKISEQDLKRSITAQYITTFGDQQQIIFYTNVIGILKDQNHIIKNLAENNIYRQTDYLTFLVTMKQQELQLKQLIIQSENDFAMLNYLCGITDTAYDTLTPPSISLQSLPEASNSIFYLHFKTDSLNLQNDLCLLNYSYRPKINAFANAGFSSSLQYRAYENFGYSFGVNLSIPIYDGRQKNLLQQKINFAEKSVTAYRSFFSKQYNREISRLKQQLSATESLIIDINEQIKYAEALITVNKKLLETGDAKIADFVIALNNYLTAKNLLTQNNISRMQIINQLNYYNR